MKVLVVSAVYSIMAVYASVLRYRGTYCLSQFEVKKKKKVIMSTNMFLNYVKILQYTPRGFIFMSEPWIVRLKKALQASQDATP